MSAFIHSMAFAGLSERPPESNVTPLPVIAYGRAVPAPLYVSSMRRGGFTLPRPTPMMPPKPPRLSSASVHTLTCSPASLAMRRASLAR